MLTLTAIIRARPECRAQVRAALEEVGRYAQAHEPGTVGFYVAQGTSDPCVFTTFERFAGPEAMSLHNDGPGSRGFFAATTGMLDGDVTVVVGQETFTL